MASTSQETGISTQVAARQNHRFSKTRQVDGRTAFVFECSRALTLSSHLSNRQDGDEGRNGHCKLGKWFKE